MTELAQQLTAFLTGQIPAATYVEINNLTPVSGGNARKAFSFDLVLGHKNGHRDMSCMMLMQTDAGQLESDLTNEFRVLGALNHTSVRAPRALWANANGRALGSPMFIMERVAGATDFLALRAPEPAERNRAIAVDFAHAAAELHAVDMRYWRYLDAPPRETVANIQVAYWEAQFLKHRMEPHPAITFAFRWLKDHAPVAERISMVHGDFRFGNFLFEGERITALLDWEMAHLGDPVEDIAWAYRALWTPEMHLPLDQFVTRYEATGGPKVRPENLLFYRLFGEVKHAVISLTAARSFADGRTNNLRLADRMTLALPCIRQFLDWLPA